MVEHLLSYPILLFGISVGKALIDTTFKAIICDEIKSAELKKYAFYWLYFCINIGGALGPLLGVTYTLHHPFETFLCLMTLYTTYILISFAVFKTDTTTQAIFDAEHLNLS